MTSRAVLNRPGTYRKALTMLTTDLPRRWKDRTHQLSETVEPSPIERICKHPVWVRKNCDLVCRDCGRLS